MVWKVIPMKLRVGLYKDGKVTPGADVFPTFTNLHADYERGLALITIPEGFYPAFMKEFEHPEDAAIDEGEIKHLTLAQRDELKRWMHDALPTRPEFENLDLG